MDSRTKTHYENHLGNFYDWMIGDFDAKLKDELDFLRDQNVLPAYNKLALDLGAGNGLHSIPLARLDFNVKAVDFNTQLTDQLMIRKELLPIEVILEDITALDKITSDSSVELIVCMGDTIAHLSTFDELKTFCKLSFQKLSANGKFIVSFRDYSAALLGTNRFIPVKSDSTRILTCVLDYPNETHVTVTDMLYEWKSELNNWQYSISSYEKIRVSEVIVRDILVSCGFVEVNCINRCRMLHMICKKI